MWDHGVKKDIISTLLFVIAFWSAPPPPWAVFWIPHRTCSVCLPLPSSVRISAEPKGNLLEDEPNSAIRVLICAISILEQKKRLCKITVCKKISISSAFWSASPTPQWAVFWEYLPLSQCLPLPYGVGGKRNFRETGAADGRPSSEREPDGGNIKATIMSINFIS